MQPTPSADKNKGSALKANQAMLALVFGLIFGFLLQKGGVAKYHILMGALLFQDFTVFKVMLSAIITGMFGILILNRFKQVELKLKPTRLGANIIGGLVFGAGFGFAGYCPGTGAAALGQANWDALFVIGGMIAGSFLFAEASAWLGRTVEKWGDRGKLTLPDFVGLPRDAVILGWAFVLVTALLVLELVVHR
jgi:uncharacterized membrane protein YedE/YeeE